jgi:glutamate racemase
MPHPSDPIGLFDSGVGGLTVMKQVMKLLPHERLIYFGDIARVPYGNKGKETIIRYSIENTVSLLDKKIKLLIVACNTATASALPKLHQLFQLPIIGVIEPGAKKAVKVTRNKRIAVLGTHTTINSGAYQEAILKLDPDASVFPIACPLLVHLVEENWIDHPATRLIAQEYLRPLKGKGIDTLLLGCTHYPFLAKVIQDEVGENIILVDSASTCAEEVAAILRENSLLSSHLQGEHSFYSSDDPEKLRESAEKLFHFPLPKVELMLHNQIQI